MDTTAREIIGEIKDRIFELRGELERVTKEERYTWEKLRAESDPDMPYTNWDYIAGLASRGGDYDREARVLKERIKYLEKLVEAYEED